MGKRFYYMVTCHMDVGKMELLILLLLVDYHVMWMLLQWSWRMEKDDALATI
jgi:hypothetical protein